MKGVQTEYYKVYVGRGERKWKLLFRLQGLVFRVWMSFRLLDPLCGCRDQNHAS